jgi:hypothetical protein
LDVVAAVVGGLEVLAAGGRPPHRPAQPDRQRGHQHLFGVQVQLGSEATADVWRHHTQPVLGERQDLGEHPLDDVWRLGAAVDGHRAGTVVVVGQHRPRLQRARDQVLVSEPLADNDGGGLLRRGVVARAGGESEQDVAVLRGAVQVRVHQGGVGLRGPPRVGHRGQRLVADLDGLHRVGGRVGVDGDYRGDCLTVEPDHLVGEHAVNRHLHAGQHPVGRQRGHPLEQVGAGDDRHHARHPAGPVHRNRPDVGVRVRAAQQHEVQHARGVGRSHVVGEPSAPPKVMVILPPW